MEYHAQVPQDTGEVISHSSDFSVGVSPNLRKADPFSSLFKKMSAATLWSPLEHKQDSSEYSTIQCPEKGTVFMRSSDKTLSTGNVEKTSSGERDRDTKESSHQEELGTARVLLNILDVEGSLQTAEMWIENLIQFHEQEASKSPGTHKSKTEMLDALGNHLRSLSSVSANLELINRVVACRNQAILLTPNDDPLKIQRLILLGEYLASRIYVQTNLLDTEHLIECYVKLRELCHAENLGQTGVLDRLAVAYAIRYSQTKELRDINLAIEYGWQSVTLIEDAPVAKSLRLTQLGTYYQTIFTRCGAAEDINKAVEYHTQALIHLDNGIKDRTEYLWNLATAFQQRFQHLGEPDDFEHAVECITLASQGTFAGHKSKHEVFNGLGILHRNRFERLGRLEDIDTAIGYHTQAFQLIHQEHPEVPRMLDALATCRTLRFGYLNEQADIDQAIEYATRAISLTREDSPQRRERLSNLGSSYHTRFMHLGNILDIDKSIESHKQAILLTPDGHIDKARWLMNLGNTYRHRFHRFGETLDLDLAIECQFRGLELMPEGHHEKPRSFGNLGNAYADRFKRLGKLADINQAIEYQTLAIELTPEGYVGRAMWLLSLGNCYADRFQRLGMADDINRAIECQTEGVLLTPEGHIDRARSLDTLGNSYGIRFQHLKNTADIDKAVACHAQAVFLIPEKHADASLLLSNLGTSYLHRFSCTDTREDVYRAVCYFDMAANHSAGSPSIRFEAAKTWAVLLDAIPSYSHLPAYSVAMRLVPEVVRLGSTINRRHADISSIGAIAVQAAAAAIADQKYDLALEWLEEGRSIVWNQTQQLRSPLDDLFAINPALALRLQEVTLGLESASAWKPSLASGESFDDVGQQQRSLAQLYHDLLSEVRLLPGFGSFLRPRKAAEIMRAAQSGPVIVINVHKTQCDALALLPGNDSILHIPLPDLSQDDVTGLRAQMEESLRSNDLRERRLYRAGEKDTDYFETILAALWHKIAKPILDILGYMGNRSKHQLPHITWCTTGDLSFLPIHAAGCYDQSQPNMFDLAISSYTPTLGALLSLSSRSSAAVTGILAVGQEATSGCAPLPGTREELASIERHAKTIAHKQLHGHEATVAAVLDAMETHDSVHLACHASQNVDNPTESGFHLHDGTLSLAEIAKRSFKNKRLAFLSACQTAAGDKKLPDEAVHLAAGMMVAGYPSVIATMWSIKDNDAPLIADRVYTQLLQGGGLNTTGGPAEALHAAVGALRAKVGEKEFSRWVPYIHMGV